MSQVPPTVALFKSLIQLFVSQGQFDQGSLIAKYALTQISPGDNTDQAYFNATLADLASKEGNTAGFLQYAELSTQEAQNNPQDQKLLALAQAQTGDFTDANAAGQQLATQAAAETDATQSAQLYEDAAQIFSQTFNYDQAMQNVNAAIQQNPTLFGALALKA